MVAWSQISSFAAETVHGLSAQLRGYQSYTTVGLAAVSLTLAACLLSRNGSGLPGPIPVPIFGSLPGIIWHGGLENYLDAMRDKYGDVYEIELGGYKKVVINGYDLTHEILVKRGNVTSNRVNTIFPTDVEKIFTGKNNEYGGLVWGDDDEWKEHRKFALTKLKDEGMGKKELEPQIQEEIQEYLIVMQKHSGAAYDMAEVIHLAVSNVIQAILLGNRSDYDDEVFREQVEALRTRLEATLQASSTNNIPFINWLPGDLTAKAKMRTATEAIQNHLVNCISEHKKNLDLSNPKGYLDHYLVRMQQAAGQETSFNEGNLIYGIHYLFLAGSDSTSTTMRWAMLYMAVYPEIQGKIHKEIDEVIGDRTPSYRDPLPYTDAVIKEILRIINLGPILFPHRADEDMMIQGHKVKAGSEFTFNMSSLLYDPATFPKPRKFIPERFLGEEGKMRAMRSVVFGLGPRVCLGEALVRMELKLFFVSTLQRYRVEPVPGITPSLVKIDGLLHSPPPQELVYVQRK